MFIRGIPLILACLAAYGQTFEAASIKPATPSGKKANAASQKGGPGTADPGLFTCRNCSLSQIMEDAYEIRGYDFSGPGWLEITRFDFMAKVPAGATREEFQTMLRNLLAERFKLALHREKRPMPVVELTVAKNGPRFKEGVPGDAPPDDGPAGKLKRDADGFPILPPGTGVAMVPGHGRMRLENQPIELLISVLSSQLDSPVIDATGLTGTYDLEVSWAWDKDAPGGAIPASATALIGAVQSQLGLKLERKKGEAEVLIVDYTEKVPTEN
jgi:uncharacterized protein (TIGR03435 family)